MTLHQLPAECRHIPDPERFTYPFCYTPHPLCLAAAQQLRTYLEGQDRWAEELSAGKMLGVLVVRHQGERGFLAAFSGRSTSFRPFSTSCRPAITSSWNRTTSRP